MTTKKTTAKRVAKKSAGIPHQVHQVKTTINLEELPQAKSAIQLTILSDGETLGHITIGRGSLTWKGKGMKTTRKMLTWPRFAEIMENL